MSNNFTEDELEYLIKLINLSVEVNNLSTDLKIKRYFDRLSDELAGRFCRCIQHVQGEKGKSESDSVKICGKSVFGTRGLMRGNYQCGPNSLPDKKCTSESDKNCAKISSLRKTIKFKEIRNKKQN